MGRFALSTLVLAAALAGPASAGGSGWLTDHKKAVKKAEKDNLPLLVDFTGSDWCGWCIKLKKEVFNKAEFQKWAKKNVVLLELDFPKRKKLDKKTQAQNEELRKKYDVRGFPTILFLDSKGKVLGKSGYREGGPKAWIEHAQGILDKAAESQDLWMTDFEEAKKRARKERKIIVADFTGSDWCGWCIKLKKEVFSTPEFKKWAAKKVILLELDYPRRTPQSDDLKKQNAELKQKYQIRGYPTILFLDSKGKVVGRSGYKPGGPDAWIKDAEKQMK